MKPDTIALELPSLTAHLLKEDSHLIDNLVADLWQQAKLKSLIVTIQLSQIVRQVP